VRFSVVAIFMVHCPGTISIDLESIATMLMRNNPDHVALLRFYPLNGRSRYPLTLLGNSDWLRFVMTARGVFLLPVVFRSRQVSWEVASEIWLVVTPEVVVFNIKVVSILSIVVGIVVGILDVVRVHEVVSVVQVSRNSRILRSWGGTHVAVVLT
jgi:hypothetical protein